MFKLYNTLNGIIQNYVTFKRGISKWRVRIEKTERIKTDSFISYSDHIVG